MHFFSPQDFLSFFLPFFLDRLTKYRFTGLPSDISSVTLKLYQEKSGVGGFAVNMSGPCLSWKKGLDAFSRPPSMEQVGGGRFPGSGWVSITLDTAPLLKHMYAQQKRHNRFKGRVCLILHSWVCGQVYFHGIKHANRPHLVYRRRHLIRPATSNSKGMLTRPLTGVDSSHSKASWLTRFFSNSQSSKWDVKTSLSSSKSSPDLV